MDRNRHNEITKELISLCSADNQGRVSELLTELSEGFESALTTSEGFESRISELTANNEKLRSVNADLFLKVGTIKTGASDPVPPQESDIPDITFESLFNEKGELI